MDVRNRRVRMFGVKTTDVRNSEWRLFVTKYYGCSEQKRIGVRYKIFF
jgi:hypothetical protein